MLHVALALGLSGKGTDLVGSLPEIGIVAHDVLITALEGALQEILQDLEALPEKFGAALGRVQAPLPQQEVEEGLLLRYAGACRPGLPAADGDGIDRAEFATAVGEPFGELLLGIPLLLAVVRQQFSNHIHSGSRDIFIIITIPMKFFPIWKSFGIAYSTSKVNKMIFTSVVFTDNLFKYCRITKKKEKEQ
jgi:hypothetical protein